MRGFDQGFPRSESSPGRRLTAAHQTRDGGRGEHPDRRPVLCALAASRGVVPAGHIVCVQQHPRSWATCVPCRSSHMMRRPSVVKPRLSYNEIAGVFVSTTALNWSAAKPDSRAHVIMSVHRVALGEDHNPGGGREQPRKTGRFRGERRVVRHRLLRRGDLGDDRPDRVPVSGNRGTDHSAVDSTRRSAPAASKRPLGSGTSLRSSRSISPSVQLISAASVPSSL